MASRRLTLFTDDGPHLDRFGLLLGLSALSITILMFVDLDDPTSSLWAEIGWLSVTVIVGLTMSLSLRAAGAARRPKLIGDIVVIATVVVVFGSAFASGIFDTDPLWTGKPSMAWAILAMVAPVLVLRRVMMHRTVTRQTLFGAMAVYLLIAVAFNYAFSAVGNSTGVEFFGVNEPSTSFMYFSLVTITTLGYGDLHPISTVARYLATTEAILGQILLVTVVARLVAMYAANSSPTDIEQPEPSSPS